MAEAALDASALLALILNEPGAEAARRAVPDGAVSAVTWTEVVQRLTQLGQEASWHRWRLQATGLDIVPFDTEDAHATAALRPPTRALGLSLADRACLALAGRLRVPAYTADRRWADLNLGVDIVVIR
jgi:PIN domain nuclease of toxin-antitoxin system